MPAYTSPATLPANDVRTDDRLQAVLWDMDGTIVDTEPYWIAAEKGIVEEHGGTWTDADSLAVVGQALPTTAALLQNAGVDLGIREIIDRLTDDVVAAVRREVPFRPGARELLEDLRSHAVPCAMVTMSEGPLARLVADALPAGTFRFLVTGDMVTRGKPDPEPYLLALRRLAATIPGLDPARVVALEDSNPGVCSAAASGAATIAVPHITALPDGGNWTVWETLEGVDTAQLDEFIRGHATTAQPRTGGDAPDRARQPAAGSIAADKTSGTGA